MTILSGSLHLLALVLVVSGFGKLVQPAPAATAMRDAGLPVPARALAASGIALGVVEASIGLVALAVPTWWAATLLGAFYAALVAFVVRLRSLDPLAGCGCFGAGSTPPGVAHLVLNTVAAGVAFVTATSGVPDIVDVFDEGVGIAVPYVALLAIGAGTVLVAPALGSQLAQLRAGEVPPAFAPVRSERTS